MWPDKPDEPDIAKLPLHVCVHLSGPKNDNYIWLCRTRSLGGVSPELRAVGGGLGLGMSRVRCAVVVCIVMYMCVVCLCTMLCGVGMYPATAPAKSTQDPASETH